MAVQVAADWEGAAPVVAGLAVQAGDQGEAALAEAALAAVGEVARESAMPQSG